MKRSAPTFDLGAALVEDGLVTAAQLQRAERVRKKLRKPRSLESVLSELGFLFRRDLREVYARRGRPMPLGAILVERAAATPEDVDAALGAQERGDRRRLGEILMDAGRLSESALLDALGEQSGHAVIAADLMAVDPVLVRKVSRSFLERAAALPFSQGSEGVTVLFAEPPSAATLAELSRALGGPVIPALARRSQILEALRGTRAKPDGATTQGAGQLEHVATGAVALVDSLLDGAIRAGASHVHVEPLRDRVRVRYRIDGELETRTELPLEVGRAVVSRIKVLAECDVAEHRRPQDGRFDRRTPEGEVDIRVSLYSSLYGENLLLRLLHRRRGLLRLEELGMAPTTLRRFREEVLELPTGVVLVTGPTGSGKTSTLYSALAHVSRPNLKIITVEDPVEYALPGVVQCQVNPKIGQGFAESLRAVVRQDPDVIVVGEVRDRATAEAAVQAALTGHKVYSTLHTEDSVGALLRLQEMDVETFLIASTVIAVVAQRLVRKVCSDCRESYPDEKNLRRFGLSPSDLRGYSPARGRGCSSCRGTGYRGRTGIYELLVIGDEVKEALRRREAAAEVRRLATAGNGLVSLQEHGLAQVLRGVTTFEEVLENVPRLAPQRPLAEAMRALGYEEGR
jgi:type IV pilus assembly protein PilB